MQRTILITLIAICFSVFGCGDTDLLDQVGQRYTASIAIQDLDEETLTVDVIQSYCDDDVEDFGPVSAAVSFAVDTDAPGITLQNYTLTYIPLESEDGTGTVVMPPTLDGPLDGGNIGIDITSGGSSSFEITCMSTDTKEEYRLKVGWVLNVEDPAGLALIAAKDAELSAKQQEIYDKEDEIVAEDQAGNPTDGLELQLERLEAEYEELELEYNQLQYGYYSTPELQEARYLIRITFEFLDQYGTTRTISREKTVWLGPYNRC